MGGLQYRKGMETAAAAPKLIFNYGMGKDSTAILLRWLEDPSSRDFELSDLTVITSMTGDEFAETARLVRTHILPRLNAAGIRFVQVAKPGPSKKLHGRYAVLADTTVTTTLHIGGAWTLSNELKAGGLVPQVGGARKCSIKFKGEVIDAWLETELEGAPYRQVMGFAKGEEKRAARDTKDGDRPGRIPEYPLLTWGWDRPTLSAYIESVVGEPWAKSCCEFCPFSSDKHQDRYAADPDAAIRSMNLELTAVALNPRSTLFANASVVELTAANHPEIADRFYAELAEADWAIYDVRRVMLAKGVAWRSIRTVDTGSHVHLSKALRAAAAAEGRTVETTSAGLVRSTVTERTEGVFPSPERFFVIAPAGVEDKERAGFDARFDAAMAAA